MGYSEPTRLRLATLSGNECAFPGCTQPIFDTDHGVMIGEVCHIKGKKPGSARYDKDQSDEERDAFENLILMCSAHHDIIDKPATRDAFSVEMIQGYKREHETRFRNTVVKEDMLSQFAKIFSQLAPVKPKVSLTPIVTAQLDKVDHQSDMDFYTVRIELRNDGTKTIREFAIEVEIPETYVENAGSYAANVNPKRPGTKMFRHTEQSFGRGVALYSGDSYPVFSLGFVLKKRHYLQGLHESIKVSVYENDEPVSVTEHPMADMLNAERVEMVLGPRLNAIKKICQTAWNRVGEHGEPTSETLYLTDEPDPTELSPQTRSVYLKDAYNTGKALEKAGWIVFESEDAMSIRLTDEGARVGS